MKVILLQELRGKGGEGDIVEVATGYAVNFLFPKKIAIEASRGNLKQLELRRHNIEKREAARLDTADKLLAALEGKVVRIPAKVGEEGQLFGSVTTTQIAEALSTLHDIEVDRKSIDLHGLIKTVGEHTAVISIYRDVKATIQVLVVDESAVIEETDEAVSEAKDNGAASSEAEEAEAEQSTAENGEAVDAADADVAETVDAVEADAVEAAADVAAETDTEEA